MTTNFIPGSETLVNTNIIGVQNNPKMATLSDGSYIITWQDSSGLDGNNWGVFAQRFNSVGEPISAVITVNTYIADNQAEAVVTGLNDGGFVIAWQSNQSQDGDSEGIFYRQFDANNNPVSTVNGGQDGLVNNIYTSGGQVRPQITTLSSGGYVITWASSGPDGSGRSVAARIFNSDGSALTDEFLVNSYTDGDQNNPSVVALDNGGFVVAWQTQTLGDNIVIQRFDAAGEKIGLEFQVNNSYSNSQYPIVESLVGGGFVVGWQEYYADEFSESGAIHLQRFYENGSELGDEIVLNNSGLVSILPDITSLPDGGFVVTWHAYDQYIRDENVFAQVFDVNGTTSGDIIFVNTYTQGGQTTPSIITLDDGSFVISWQDGDQEGNSWGVYQKKVYC